MSTGEIKLQQAASAGLTVKTIPLSAHVQSAFQYVLEYLALSIWIFGLVFWTVGFLVALATLPNPYAIGFLVVQATLLLLPLDGKPPYQWIERALEFAVKTGLHYFPITVQFEDREAFKEAQPYMFGYEPHSVLPFGICIFSKQTGLMPPVLQNARILASSAGFWCAGMRHLWYWLGIRPVSKSVIRKLLANGSSCVLCPGGVQECLYMQHGYETVYLKKRHGFVRLALEAGAPLVPVFAFGQTGMFRCVRPFLDWPKGIIPKSWFGRFARRVGYVPMLIFGAMGTPMPMKSPTHIVVGRPIPVPKVENPSPEVVDQYLKQFIRAIEEMFHAHNREAGHGATDLIVY